MDGYIADGRFRIAEADSGALYEGLRDLWCRVFGDRPDYVDMVYRLLDARGLVVTDETGRVVSALTRYRCGTYCVPEGYRDAHPDFPDLDGRPVYVNYAICTDPDHRGLGLAGALIHHADSLEQGAISIVSPAEQSLTDYYDRLGYEEHFSVHHGVAFADTDLMDDGWEEDEDDDFEPFEPAISVTPAGPEAYNMYREAFLAGTPHITLSSGMLELIRAESLEGNGLMIINSGDAICVIDGTMPEATELIVNPMLMDISLEIDQEIAMRLAGYYGVESFSYRTPGYGRCQSMIMHDAPAPADTASQGHADTYFEEDFAPEYPPYYGFPIE